jgi:cytochrome c553
MKSIIFIFCLLCLGAGFESCIRTSRDRGYEYAPNMYESVPYNPDSPDPISKSGSSSLNPVVGTIPTSAPTHLVNNFEPMHYPNSLEGYEKAGAEMKNPIPFSRVNLAEGKQLYTSYCSHCHGASGQGDGAVAMDQASVKPPSYSVGNSSRSGIGQMKNLTDGKIYHTITYGINNMGAHSSQLNSEERWKIILYVHELQQGRP